MAAKKKSAPAATQAKDSKYKVLRNVTMPTLKLELEVPAHVKATGEYFTGKAQKPGKDGKAMEPATVLPVINVDTGEVAQLILGAALKSILEETYPAHAYVDRAFRIVKHDKQAGKRYFTYSVDEIEA
jgi:hypothetical protein